MRREFIGHFSSTIVAWPLTARAQQAAMPVIGFLNSGSPEGFTPQLAGFRQGLNEVGYTATRKIKADPALQSIPIIAVTSYALSGEEKKARVAGCDDYVPKPFSPRQLLAKIRHYLQ